MQLHKIYTPKTASPFANSETYMEFAPCEALKPYIQCFWGSRLPYRQLCTERPAETLVTPDTCVDIIFHVNFTDNRIEGHFCGVDDRPFVSHAPGEEKLLSTFAIRFYVWSAVLFAEDTMKDTRNKAFDLDCHFAGLKKALEPQLFDCVRIEDRIFAAEQYLSEHLHLERQNPLVMEGLEQIMLHRGTLEIGHLSKEVHTSSRQLERLFLENMGISPKRLSSLVRYQYLWNDILCQPDFQVTEAVHRYGYVDQAHLLHEFKRFHGMNIAGAKAYAGKDLEKYRLPDNDIGTI